VGRKKVSVSNNADTTDIITGLSEEESRIDAAKKILMEAGYRISPPLVVDSKIDSVQKLLNYFYMRLDAKHPSNKQSLRSTVFDLGIMSKFVQSQCSGTSYATAIQTCVSLINVLFDYEHEFNFKYPISDVGILGQGKMAWVTAKAFTILSAKQTALLEQSSVQKCKDIEESYAVSSDAISSDLDEMLKNMEENNGED